MSHKRKRATTIVETSKGILLVSHSRHGKPMYMLPGGGVRHGEKSIHAAKRELYEETGLHVSKIRFLFNFEATQHHRVFCAKTYGRLKKRHETTHIRFYNENTKHRYRLAGSVKPMIEKYKAMM
jgi:8-oxo-dGTP pyrophosphatase MutT (NUDIX family)